MFAGVTSSSRATCPQRANKQTTFIISGSQTLDQVPVVVQSYLPGGVDAHRRLSYGLVAATMRPFAAVLQQRQLVAVYRLYFFIIIIIYLHSMQK